MSDEVKLIAIGKVKPNKNNPRFIKDESYEKLLESIRKFPSMLKLRKVIVNDEMIIQGGNMRYRACKELGYKKIPYDIYTKEMYEIDLIARRELAQERGEDYTDETYEQLCKEFVIRDNVEFGQHDFDILGNEYDFDELVSWGVDVPGLELDEDGLGTDFDLPDGEKPPFESMTFKLSDEQAEQLKNALEDVKSLEEFKYVETFGNENGNGNALYLLAMQWKEGRK